MKQKLEQTAKAYLYDLSRYKAHLKSALVQALCMQLRKRKKLYNSAMKHREYGPSHACCLHIIQTSILNCAFPCDNFIQRLGVIDK